MTYEVVVLPSAEREMDETHRWLSKNLPSYADKWYNGIIEAILSLEEFPLRCPLARENFESETDEIRQHLFGKRRDVYRILFTIRGNRVLILHVRHAACVRFD